MAADWQQVVRFYCWIRSGCSEYCLYVSNNCEDAQRLLKAIEWRQHFATVFPCCVSDGNPYDEDSPQSQSG